MGFWKRLVSKLLFWKAKESGWLEHPLYREIHSKGMEGKPVVCLCGSVYSDHWAFCKDCGRRKSDLPIECFPFGKSVEKRIYKAPGGRR